MYGEGGITLHCLLRFLLHDIFLGSCCTCAKVVALVDARKCGHLQCRECKMVKYPACPICYPFMENVRFWNIPATTMDFTFSVRPSFKFTSNSRD